jgi:hypothetical protein
MGIGWKNVQDWFILVCELELGREILEGLFFLL